MLVRYSALIRDDCVNGGQLYPFAPLATGHTWRRAPRLQPVPYPRGFAYRRVIKYSMLHLAGLQLSLSIFT